MAAELVSEQLHQYPRRIRWSIELLCTAVVTLATLRFGRDLLLYLWARYGLDGALFPRIPLLADIARTLRATSAAPREYVLASLLPSLGWLALALLLALLLRNSLPTIRTSARGLLVEFAGSWLAVPWESVRTIKVTEDASAERFVLLALTDGRQLTGWHRLYNFCYNFGLRRGFLITSWISNFDKLIKTLLNETDRVARVLEEVKPTQLQEEASSALFRFLLGPASFFSQRTKEEVAAAPAAPTAVPVSPDAALAGTYPRRIRSLVQWSTRIILAIAVFRYIVAWLTFLALTFPQLRTLPVFNRLTLFQAQQDAPWWVLVAGHLMLLAALGVVAVLRHLLPDLEARREGLALRRGRGWLVVPWARIRALKVTEVAEQSQIILIQTRGGMPLAARFSSLFYDSSFAPGLFITSALNSFDDTMKRIVLEVTRHQEVVTEDDPPILQDEAQSPLLSLSFNAGATIDSMVARSREDGTTMLFDAVQLRKAARPMLALALLPVLIVFAGRAIQQGILPDLRLLIGMIFLFVLGMLEWPIVCLAAQMFDDSTGGGEEGARPFYLYPQIQLPRVLPLCGALVATLLGIPALPVLLWIGAIVWSFLLAAGLWEAMYDWRGGQLLAGGLMPVVFQLIVLLSYLIVL